MASSKSEKPRQLLIIGINPASTLLSSLMDNNPELGFSLLGYLNPDREESCPGIKYLGSIPDEGYEDEIIKIYSPTDVLISLPPEEHLLADRLISNLYYPSVSIWINPESFLVYLFAGQPQINRYLQEIKLPKTFTKHQRRMKRSLDLFVSLVLFIPSLFLMALVAIVVRLQGPGPILIRQPRVGEFGKLFRMYKFRTMLVQADRMRYLVEYYDEQGNYIHKTANDPRVTRLGRFLRRASLDELPQIFNVLKGEMSWVGPRPELSFLVTEYQPWQYQRLAVPQGITGWWQTHDRSEKPMHLFTEDDLYYIEHYSLSMDIKILIWTGKSVLLGKGAY